MFRTAITILTIAAVAYLGACALLFFYQRALIYFPQPAGLGAAAHTQRLNVPGATLQLSVRPHPGSKAVLYFGGNAEDVSASLPALASAFPDSAVFLVHYRGYGGSTGQPSETALHHDAAAVLDWVLASHPAVTVIGRSLGSGVAVRLASMRLVTRLVLVTPYDSIVNIAAQQFPYFPVRWLLQDRFESWRYAPQIGVPTVIVASEYDVVIPKSSTDALVAKFAPGVASYRTLGGVDHNTISQHPEYLQALRGAP